MFSNSDSQVQSIQPYLYAYLGKNNEDYKNITND